MGALLVQLLDGIAADPGAYRTGDTPRLGTAALDLVSALLAHHLDAEDAVPPESRRRALIQRVRAFVRAHLHEPDLNPGASPPRTTLGQLPSRPAAGSPAPPTSAAPSAARTGCRPATTATAPRRPPVDSERSRSGLPANDNTTGAAAS
ncbi:hypothetical protein ACFWJ4_41260 [Kitasatospora sp. NPDC127067]|uniref:hypothetical protein n=1 Tax=Kitasatospora sp. NPDC127067 TaxID=3347126 RepID=UPI003646FD7B